MRIGEGRKRKQKREGRGKGGDKQRVEHGRREGRE